MTEIKEENFECWGVYVKGCVTRRVLSRVADKWTILIVARLSERIYRFGELRRAIEGISAKVLTQTLKTLEGDGLVQRTVLATRPPSVEYALTPLGKTFVGVALQIKDWAETHALEIVTQKTQT